LFVTLLYAIAFVGNLLVSKSVDTGLPVPLTEALIIDTLLLSLVCDSTQRDGSPMVQTRLDQNRAQTGGAQHLCATGKSGVAAALLAVASNDGSNLGCAESVGKDFSASSVSGLVGARSSYQPLLSIIASLFGLRQVRRYLKGNPRRHHLQNAWAVQSCASPAVSRIHHRLLEHADT
jgi:hypothetical protein